MPNQSRLPFSVRTAPSVTPARSQSCVSVFLTLSPCCRSFPAGCVRSSMLLVKRTLELIAIVAVTAMGTLLFQWTVEVWTVSLPLIREAR